MALIELSDIINVEWLQNENVMLRVEDNKIPYRTFTVCRLLKRQLPEYSKSDIVKFLTSVFTNVERSTIYNWMKNNFDPKKCYPKFYKLYTEKLPASGKETFIIQVISKEKQPRVLDDVKCCIEAIESAVFNPVKSKKPDLNFTKIIEQRAQELQKPAAMIDSIETMEELVVKLCEDFATGLITITEACERHGITYLQFVEVLNQSDHCKMIYDKACRYANTLQNSRQLTLVDNMLIQLLTTQQHVTETIYFEKHLVPGRLEPKWIEKKKTRVVRQLSPSEVITLKMMLTKSVLMSNTAEGSEFATWSEAELMDYVAKNNAELQKMLTANPVLNGGFNEQNA